MVGPWSQLTGVGLEAYGEGTGNSFCLLDDPLEGLWGTVRKGLSPGCWETSLEAPPSPATLRSFFFIRPYNNDKGRLPFPEAPLSLVLRGEVECVIYDAARCYHIYALSSKLEKCPPKLAKSKFPGLGREPIYLLKLTAPHFNLPSRH